MPWPFTDKSGTPTNQALNGEFYEGGINLSSLGLGSECFASIGLGVPLVDVDHGDPQGLRPGQLRRVRLDDDDDAPDGRRRHHHRPQHQRRPGSVDRHRLGRRPGPRGRRGHRRPDVGRQRGVQPVRAAARSPRRPATARPAAHRSHSSPRLRTRQRREPAVDSQDTTLTKVGRYCWRATFTATTPASRAPILTPTPEHHRVLRGPAGDAGPGHLGGCRVVLGNPISDTATLAGTANKPGTNGIGRRLDQRHQRRGRRRHDQLRRQEAARACTDHHARRRTAAR